MIGKGDPHMINASEINANERCINFTNGIYDTKYNKLLEHSPKLISTIQIPCTFDPGTVPSCPAIWKNFIAHCFDNDEEQINLLYKIFGVAISNIKAWRGKKSVLHNRTRGYRKNTSAKPALSSDRQRKLRHRGFA